MNQQLLNVQFPKAVQRIRNNCRLTNRAHPPKSIYGANPLRVHISSVHKPRCLAQDAKRIFNATRRAEKIALCSLVSPVVVGYGYH